PEIPAISGEDAGLMEISQELSDVVPELKQKPVKKSKGKKKKKKKPVEKEASEKKEKKPSKKPEPEKDAPETPEKKERFFHNFFKSLFTEETQLEETEELEETKPEKKPAVYQPAEKVTEVLISPETEKKPSLDFTPDITLRKTEESAPKAKQTQVKVKKKVTVSKKMKKK
ncbi:MAG: hypothetical protein IKI37_08705, partial [Oscillospiraceae bacterium]|nr:hypothetical protein [Oscillospiraceae bacterium]